LVKKIQQIGEQPLFTHTPTPFRPVRQQKRTFKTEEELKSLVLSATIQREQRTKVATGTVQQPLMIIHKTECCYYNDKTSVAFISKLTFERVSRRRLTLMEITLLVSRKTNASEDQTF